MRYLVTSSRRRGKDGATEEPVEECPVANGDTAVHSGSCHLTPARSQPGYPLAVVPQSASNTVAQSHRSSTLPTISLQMPTLSISLREDDRNPSVSLPASSPDQLRPRRREPAHSKHVSLETLTSKSPDSSEGEGAVLVLLERKLKL